MIVFKAHSKPVYALEFSPDGRSLVTSGGDEAVRLWSGDPPASAREWPGSEGWAPLAFSPDGRFVARGGYGVCVWAVGGPKTPLVKSKHFAESVAFSPDGGVFAAHGDSAVGLSRWSMPGGGPLAGSWGGTRPSNGGNAFPTGGMAFDPSGALLATCFGVLGAKAFDSVIYLWDARTGEQVAALRAVRYSTHPTAIRFSPDGSRLAGVYGANLILWDVRGRVEVARRQVGKKHFKGLAFTPDGRRLITVNNDERVYAWDPADWSEAGDVSWEIGKLGAVAVAPDGRRAAAGGSTGKVAIWGLD